MNDHIPLFLQRLGAHIASSAVSTASILGTVVLPIVLCCIVLYLLSSWQSKRLMRTFGWRGLLMTGWLGTPVHELSHALAAVVLGHKVREVVLFRPVRATGELGHVRHTYNPKNPYAAVLGNTLIPMAPLLGGAVVIFLLTLLLAPELLPSEGIPEGSPVTAEVLLESSNYEPLARRSWSYLLRMKEVVTETQPWHRWQFCLYLYTVFCVAMHLAPSSTDFKNFARPAILLVFLVFLVNLVATCFGDYSQRVTDFLWQPMAAVTGLLTFAMAISLVGTAATVAVTFVIGFVWGR